MSSTGASGKRRSSVRLAGEAAPQPDLSPWQILDYRSWVNRGKRILYLSRRGQIDRAYEIAFPADTYTEEVHEALRTVVADEGTKIWSHEQVVNKVRP
jgi:hypothetical protein